MPWRWRRAAVGLRSWVRAVRFGVIGRGHPPYRIDVAQGNVVTKEQLARVSPGMSRLQVRDILGSPLLTDPFHADRWDYVFTIKRPGTTAAAARRGG